IFRAQSRRHSPSSAAMTSSLRHGWCGSTSIACGWPESGLSSTHFRISGTASAWAQAGYGPKCVYRGVNPWKWTHQCVLSGGNAHHKCVIDLEVNRCSITQTRMSPPRVVSNQPPKHLTTTLEVRDPPLRSLQRRPLQRRVDRLRQGIISTRPDLAHRLDHPEPTTHRLKRRGRILTTMVAVKNRTFQCFSVVYCIL